MTTKEYKPLNIFKDFALDFIPSATFPVKLAEVSKWERTGSHYKIDSSILAPEVDRFNKFVDDLPHYMSSSVVCGGEETKDSIFTAEEAQKAISELGTVTTHDRAGQPRTRRVFVPKKSLKIPEGKDVTAVCDDDFFDMVAKKLPGKTIHKNRASFCNVDKNNRVYYFPIPDIPSLRKVEDRAKYHQNALSHRDMPFITSFLQWSEDVTRKPMLSYGATYSHGLGYRKLLEVLGFLITVNTAVAYKDTYGDMPLKEVVHQEEVAQTIRKDFANLTLRNNDNVEYLLMCFKTNRQKFASPLYVHNVKTQPVRDIISDLTVNNIVDVLTACSYYSNKFLWREYEEFPATKTQEEFYTKINAAFPPTLKGKREKIAAWVQDVAGGANAVAKENNISVEEIKTADSTNIKSVLSYADMRARKDIFNDYTKDSKFDNKVWEKMSSVGRVSPMNVFNEQNSPHNIQIVNALGVQYVLHHIPLHHLYMIMRIVNRVRTNDVFPIAKENINWYIAVAETISGKEYSVDKSYNASHALYHLSKYFRKINIPVREIRSNKAFISYSANIPMDTFLSLVASDYIHKENESQHYPRKMQEEWKNLTDVEKLIEDCPK